MKQIVTAYTFNKTAKTITLTDFSSLKLERLMLVTNLVTGTIIYQFNNSALNATVATNVITLEYDTTAMSNSDPLMIVYDTANGDPIYSADSVQGGVAAGTADSGNPVKVGGKYNSSAPTLNTGQRGDLQLDANSNVKATLATALDEDIDAVTAYTKAATYTSLTADGVVSATPVALVGFYVMASSSGVISLYDNASAASGTAILATSKSVAAGDSVILSVPIAMANGVYFDLVSGTATVLVLTRKLTSQ